MKRARKLQRLNDDLFTPLTTEESKLVGAGLTASVSHTITATISGAGPDASASIDF